MIHTSRWSAVVPALFTCLYLSACGGGSSSSSSSNPPAITATVPSEAGAPQVTGNLATDSVNWFNFRRQQIGLTVLTRNSVIDVAAQNHSQYQKLNNSVTHSEIAGRSGFTGIDALARMNQVGYSFSPLFAYAYGEVISGSSATTGASHAEELINAIYHRFVIFEPMFKEIGSGASTGTNSFTYITTNFAANNGFGPGIGKGKIITYPYANQKQISTVFFSDQESPDPVPNQNAVGFPISVHADITGNVTVQQFTVQQHGGLALPVILLSKATDLETPSSAAAIIPLNILAAGTLYDVQFIGNVDGVPVSQSWSFTTK